jgi:hypothetical protein
VPIIGWICHKCGGREVPLDHFRTTSCGRVIPPAYTDLILRDREGQAARAGEVRVTMALGCPRQAAIEQSEGYYADPLSFNAMLTGTAWDTAINHRHMKMEGTIDGVTVTGEIDNIGLSSSEPGEVVIEDWKHGSDFSAKYKREGKPEHRLQTSLYGEILQQVQPQLRGKVNRGRNWYHFSVSGKDAMFPVEYPLMPLDEILATKIGEYTVRELLHQADDHFTHGKPWQELPQVGATIFFGQKRMCDHYCAVRDVCWRAAGQPF